MKKVAQRPPKNKKKKKAQVSKEEFSLTDNIGKCRGWGNWRVVPRNSEKKVKKIRDINLQ